MCGRYATTANPARLAAELDAIDETGDGPDTTPNYNVAPTNHVLTVTEGHGNSESDERPRLRIRRMRWGLIPFWTKAAEPGVPVKGKPLFNARADKAATTASFRDGVKKRRCLVPMDGWYEWLVEGQTDKGKAIKQPYFMSPADGSRLYMAGLWSTWRDSGHPELDPVLSCTILTTDAIGELAKIHDRMPLPMPREHWDAWLDPTHPAPAELLETPPLEWISDIVARPVSPLVNSVRNNGPELLADPTGANTGQAGQIHLI
ncbi:SOS response-associated peptidase [Nocardia sp. CDC159]|uniref:Abasic site processing protein n=1 Tax=Nocardia pulmonis TaxID=2951408 RepID=A0A9X2IZ71_9NOCA|nr:MULTISPECIES: SOS response-associated peptidase [Nocardia]MCM6775705.1 SOS response-associated peptidase [Nocardia pulmonis]MCM6788319.1 SOS response-associated peptidase [Nocardia sp. CDC159]